MNDRAIDWFARNKNGVRCSRFDARLPLVIFPNKESSNDEFELYGGGDQIFQFIGLSDNRLALVAISADFNNCDDDFGLWSCAKGQLFVFDKSGYPIDDLVYRSETKVNGMMMHKGYPKHIKLDVQLEHTGGVPTLTLIV